MRIGARVWINAKIVRNELPHIYYMIWNLLLFYASSSRVTLLISIIIIIILSHTVQQPIKALYHKTRRHTQSLTHVLRYTRSFLHLLTLKLTTERCRTSSNNTVKTTTEWLSEQHQNMNTRWAQLWETSSRRRWKNTANYVQFRVIKMSF